ncbi:hypothetical protein ACJMK2_013657, partial [Sinanodonta woodiana]
LRLYSKRELALGEETRYEYFWENVLEGKGNAFLLYFYSSAKDASGNALLILTSEVIFIQVGENEIGEMERNQIISNMVCARYFCNPVYHGFCLALSFHVYHHEERLWTSTMHVLDI